MTPSASRNPTSPTNSTDSTNSTNPTNSTNSINTHLLSHRFAYFRPNSLAEALAMRKEHPDAAVLAGGTNLVVDMKLGKIAPAKVIDITFLSGLSGIAEESGGVRIGALTPIRDLATSALLWTSCTALAEAAAAFGSTQVALRGTLGGNICNGSPASDTVPALLVLGAEATLVGPGGERTVPLGDLLASPGKVRLRDGEILTAVRLPKSAGSSGSAFVKIGRVRADLAKASAAVRVTRDESGRCASARIELGSVGPTALRARKAELLLSKEEMTDARRLTAAEAAAAEILPIDDVRSTADYRRKVAVALVHDAVEMAWKRCTGDSPVNVALPRFQAPEAVMATLPRERPAPAAFPRLAETVQGRGMLTGEPATRSFTPVLREVPSLSVDADESVPISLTVNGDAIEIDVAPNDLLLNVLRERLELTGAKYGCGIGECGACTVWLDGRPTLACLVLAVSADGGDVRTIEGLAAPDGTLDPVQQAFIDENAFQCGYCTPGMVLMTKKLLEEIPQPTEDEIRDYLKGNLCRCTGYASIVRAVERAAGLTEADGA